MATSSTVTSTARQFTNANTEYLSSSSTDFQTGNIDFMWCGWIRLDNKSTQQANVGLWSGTTTKQYFGDYHSTTDRFRFIVTHDGSTTKIVSADNFGSPSIDTWYFLEMWHDATNDVVGIRVNRGTADTAAHTTGVNTATLQFRFGAISTDQFPLDGRMAGWAFYKNTLPTTAQLDDHYNSGAGKFYTDLTDTTNMISMWDLVETSGQAYDAHGSNHLTDNNTVTSAAGIITYTAEKARDFESTNSEYFSLASPGVHSPGDTDFTVAAWVKLESVGANRAISGMINFGGAAGNNYCWLLLYLSSSSRYRFDVSSDGTTGAALHTVQSTNLVYLDRPQFVVARHDATANTIEIRVDGETFQSASHSGGVFAGDSPFRIGAYNINGLGAYMDGLIMMHGFWSSKLSDANVDALYNRGFGVNHQGIIDLGLDTNLASLYVLNEESGNAIDSVGSNDLTDNNTVTQADGVVLYTAPVVGGGGTILSRHLSNSLIIGI